METRTRDVNPAEYILAKCEKEGVCKNSIQSLVESAENMRFQIQRKKEMYSLLLSKLLGRNISVEEVQLICDLNFLINKYELRSNFNLSVELYNYVFGLTNEIGLALEEFKSADFYVDELDTLFGGLK
jgi:hypothetical protein